MHLFYFTFRSGFGICYQLLRLFIAMLANVNLNEAPFILFGVLGLYDVI